MMRICLFLKYKFISRGGDLLSCSFDSRKQWVSGEFESICLTYIRADEFV